jgi:transposase
MRATSVDLRTRVVAARLEDGQSMGQIAERFRIPKGTVQNILEHYRDTAQLERRPQNAGRKRGLSQEHVRALEDEVDRRPDVTLELLRKDLDLPVSVVTVHNTLKRLGFTLKRNCYVRANKTE